MGHFVCSSPEKDRHQFMVMCLDPQLEDELSCYFCEQGFSLLKMMATPT